AGRPRPLPAPARPRRAGGLLRPRRPRRRGGRASRRDPRRRQRLLRRRVGGGPGGGADHEGHRRVRVARRRGPRPARRARGLGGRPRQARSGGQHAARRSGGGERHGLPPGARPRRARLPRRPLDLRARPLRGGSRERRGGAAHPGSARERARGDRRRRRAGRRAGRDPGLRGPREGRGARLPDPLPAVAVGVPRRHRGAAPARGGHGDDPRDLPLHAAHQRAGHRSLDLRAQPDHRPRTGPRDRLLAVRGVALPRGARAPARRPARRPTGDDGDRRADRPVLLDHGRRRARVADRLPAALPLLDGHRRGARRARRGARVAHPPAGAPRRARAADQRAQPEALAAGRAPRRDPGAGGLLVPPVADGPPSPRARRRGERAAAHRPRPAVHAHRVHGRGPERAARDAERPGGRRRAAHRVRREHHDTDLRRGPGARGRARRGRGLRRAPGRAAGRHRVARRRPGRRRVADRRPGARARPRGAGEGPRRGHPGRARAVRRPRGRGDRRVRRPAELAREPAAGGPRDPRHHHARHPLPDDRLGRAAAQDARDEPAHPVGGVRPARPDLPGRPLRGPARLHEPGGARVHPADPALRDRLRALHGLRRLPAHAHQGGARRRGARRRGGRPRPGAHGADRHRGRAALLHRDRGLRDLGDHLHQGGRRRDRARGADRRDDRPRAARPVADGAPRPLELVGAAAAGPAARPLGHLGAGGGAGM
ncbi:MAG: Transmembrane transport protein MmpL13, partial [uncultured Solirubrobacteraceae bacterium]